MLNSEALIQAAVIESYYTYRSHPCITAILTLRPAQTRISLEYFSAFFHLFVITFQSTCLNHHSLSIGNLCSMHIQSTKIQVFLSFSSESHSELECFWILTFISESYVSYLILSYLVLSHRWSSFLIFQLILRSVCLFSKHLIIARKAVAS